MVVVEEDEKEQAPNLELKVGEVEVEVHLKYDLKLRAGMKVTLKLERHND